MVICGKVLIYAQFGLAVKALMDSHLPRVSFTAIHYGCRSPCTLWYQGVAMIITLSTLYQMLVTKSLGKIQRHRISVELSAEVKKVETKPKKVHCAFM